MSCLVSRQDTLNADGDHNFFIDLLKMVLVLIMRYFFLFYIVASLFSGHASYIVCELYLIVNKSFLLL